MEEQAKETVIIVHGTWAAPVANQLQWYHSDGDKTKFVSKLNDALQTRGSGARCWAHCVEGTKFFRWSGNNSWFARTRGADTLGDYVQELRKAGWLCHIVAHSHGGNVLIEALPKIDATNAGEPPIGQLVTLGTPFINVMSPVLEKDRARREMLLGLGIMLIAMEVYGVWSTWSQFSNSHAALLISAIPFSAILLLALFLRWRKRVLRDSWSTYFRKYWARVLVEVAFWTGVAVVLEAALLSPLYPGKEIWSVGGGLVLLALMFGWRRKRKRNSSGSLASPADTIFCGEPKMLALNSCMDEAWQVLHHLRVTDNPLAVKSGLLQYLLSSLTSSYVQRKAADRLYYSPLGKVSIGPAIGAVAVYSLMILAGFAFLWSDAPLRDGDSPWRIALSLLSSFLALSVTSSLLFGDRFIAAYLFPFRWVRRVSGAIAATVIAIGPYMVRRAAWQLIVKIAMGLEGYQFPLPAVEQCPRHLGNMVMYE